MVFPAAASFALTFWTGFLGGLAAMGGTIVDMLYPRGITGFGGVVSAGTIDQFPEGSKTQNSKASSGSSTSLRPGEAERPGQRQGGLPGPLVEVPSPRLHGAVARHLHLQPTRQGWFRCPCHGSTYDDAGVRVFGPAPRSMDRMELTIDPRSGRISVNTGKITKGTTDNASFAVKG